MIPLHIQALEQRRDDVQAAIDHILYGRTYSPENVSGSFLDRLLQERLQLQEALLILGYCSMIEHFTECRCCICVPR